MNIDMIDNLLQRYYKILSTRTPGVSYVSLDGRNVSYNDISKEIDWLESKKAQLLHGQGSGTIKDVIFT